MNDRTGAPSTSVEFDKEYSSLKHWVWSDFRIPKELKELISMNDPKNSLELGCGLGFFSEYVADQGVKATGVDFSPVAIDKANKRVSENNIKPAYFVGDVTNLDLFSEPFDVSFDIGCFHCLNKEKQEKYVSEIFRLSKSGSTHLIWALDNSPSDIPLSPDYIRQLFEGYFRLERANSSRRRVIASHWYWLIREK
ncbi:MAG: class I SAM-dependent methyltransferase [Dysgonomonas sp.]|nr:class I SAM-dependent methyltransferase [Dysgonomonas sp.]